MKKHKKLLITAAVLAAMVVAAIFLLRWVHIQTLYKMYPRDYAEEVTAAAKENGLDPNLVYAVIRQESRFQADAESSAGAVGLMQLTPETFQWLQKQEHGSVTLPTSSLRNPAVNVKYGCRFLAYLIKKYGVLHTSLCAYNAGSGRVDSWLKDSSLSKDGKTLLSVPYPETEDYARKVEQNYEQYKELYGSD
ncbi:MAG: Soluble lytic murein transglycosylase [Thermocaproicibacter melissae]|jgi:soluble lytic murein transglycosylase|uniref:lytic transglycosylase domain-containing protein n=1 Tax=Thermocaproicibacter melissae TaxID=2966552 RepID=UPI0024B16D87|nr:lytic transglycosylase domain-containing protein [Thermocaproicibacter melissae]WBY63488.1 lytic transglycosylase domain-containing protein [Thermocaproicibacter melissae]